MDIAAMSMSMSNNKVQQQASLAMTKKTMDMQKVSADNLINDLKSANPSFGHKMDIRA